MRNRTVLAIAAIPLALVIAGCSASPSSSSATTPSSAVVNGLTPAGSNDVDTVTWALPSGEPPTLDPLGTVDYAPNTVISNMCESLLRTEPDLSTSPGLATKVEQPNDKTYVITVRPDVTFWNGDPVTAEDVAYSLQRFADPANGSGWIVTYLNVKSIKATGPLTVTVTMKQPDVLFRSSLATGGAFISEKSYVESAGKQYGSPSKGVMCTGPFEFDSWKSGDSITLTRNPNYWDQSLQPKVNELVFKFIDDDSTLLSALKAGEVDGAYGMSPQVFDQAKKSGIGAGYSTPGLQNLQLFAVAQSDNPLNDKRIREAWRDAQDFQGITEGIYRGTAEPASAIVGPTTWGYSQQVYQDAYDALPAATTNLDVAKQLVDEAGAPSRPIVLAVSAGGDAEQVALAAQAAGESVGIPVTIKKMSSSEFAAVFYDPAARKGIDAIVVQGFSDFPEPAEYYSFFQKGQYYNYFNYDNPQYDALIKKALRTYDDDARAKLVTQAQALIMSDLPTIPLAYPNVTLFMNSRISGAPAGWAYMSSPWAAYLGGT